MIQESLCRIGCHRFLIASNPIIFKATFRLAHVALEINLEEQLQNFSKVLANPLMD